MLLTMTVPNQPLDLLPRLLGIDPRVQHRVAVQGASATLHFPSSTDAGSRAALFVEVTQEAHPLLGPGAISVDGVSPALPVPSASLLAAAVTHTFGLTPGEGSAESCRNSVDDLDVEVPLRISVRHLFQPGTLAQAEDAFHALGWHATVIGVPFGDMPAHYGTTGFIELRLAFSGTPIGSMGRLSRLLPLLDTAARRDAAAQRGRFRGCLAPGDRLPSAMPRDGVQVAGAGLVVDPMAPPQIVAGSGSSGGSADSTEDGLSPPRQGLAGRRVGAILAVLARSGARTVLDLGCGRGDLLAILAHDSRYTRVLGVDVNATAVRVAHRRLQLQWLPDHRQVCVRVARGSLLVPDRRFRGFDVAVLMEVVEHLDPHDLPRMVEAVFGDARPRMVLVTTPNAEHTQRFPSLGRSGLRHPDHRFEWTRSEFANWVSKVASAHGYLADVRGVGSTHLAVGAPTQLAVFVRRD